MTLRCGRTDGLCRGGGIALRTVYACIPAGFETPARIGALLRNNSGLTGRHVPVPEVILARFLGLRVAALSTITNMAAGMSAEVLSRTLAKAMAPLGAKPSDRILRAWLRGKDEGGHQGKVADWGGHPYPNYFTN